MAIYQPHRLLLKALTTSRRAVSPCGAFLYSHGLIRCDPQLLSNNLILRCYRPLLNGIYQREPMWNRNFDSGKSPARLKYFLNSCKSRDISISAKDVVASSPPSIRPYLEIMRIDRPIGTWLVFLPCAWSISLATTPGNIPDIKLLSLCALGAFFMRGAGCTINDMWDKDFDSKVTRTKERPLASGRISRTQALMFLAMPLSASLAILLTLNTNTIFLGFCAILPCVIYPLMKRITYWPQVFLGMSQSWGVLIGWSAVRNGCVDASCVALYISAALWTLTYDTVYSHQDKEDDVKIGVKSTALRMGDSTKLWLSGFSGCTVAGLTAAGVLSDQTWPYYLGVAYFASHLAHQLYTVDLTNAEDCGNKFRSNRNLGLVFWLAILASTLLKKDEVQTDSNVK